MDESTKTIKFMSLTEQQIQHMKEHRTTELPPEMFKKSIMKSARQKKTDDDDDDPPADDNKILAEVAFTAFTLSTTFPQNIALMKDGSIVYCDQFLPPLEDALRPNIVGFKFQKVFANYKFYKSNVYHSI